MTSTKPSAETKTLSLEEVQVTDLSSVLPTTVAINCKLCLRETIFSPLPVITTLSTSGKTEEEVEEELEEEVEGLEVEEDEEVFEEDGVLRYREVDTASWKQAFEKYYEIIRYLEFPYPWQEGMNRLFLLQKK